MSMAEYRYSLYGTAVRYQTDVPVLAQPVKELLRHFRRDDALEADAVLALRFHQVTDRAEVPLTVSASALQLASGTGEAVGDQRATGLPYEVILDQGLMIAEFHGIGVLVIDGTQSQADGYLINPE